MMTRKKRQKITVHFYSPELRLNLTFKHAQCHTTSIPIITDTLQYSLPFYEFDTKIYSLFTWVPFQKKITPIREFVNFHL